MRRTTPGTVAVDATVLVELFRGALRVHELREEITTATAATRAADAQRRACELIVELGAAGRYLEVNSHLPLTADGSLHEAAFIALVGAEQHRRRHLRSIAS